MPNRIYLVVGHGSRSPGAVSQLEQFVEALSHHVRRPVHHCFLEWAHPDMKTGFADAAERAGEGGDVVVLPLVLGAGGHQKTDIALAGQWAQERFPEVTIRYGTPLGPHTKLIDLLSLRINQALAATTEPAPKEKTRVLIVGHGSRDPTSSSAVAQTAYLLFAGRAYQSVEYAFQAMAHPTVADGLHRCAQLGTRQLVIAPYLLFTGKAERAIRQIAKEAGEELGLRILQAETLGIHPLLLDVAAQRFAEAAHGTAAMTCDICKYRWPMAGHENQVGESEAMQQLDKESDQLFS